MGESCHASPKKKKGEKQWPVFYHFHHERSKKKREGGAESSLCMALIAVLVKKKRKKNNPPASDSSPRPWPLEKKRERDTRLPLSHTVLPNRLACEKGGKGKKKKGAPIFTTSRPSTTASYTQQGGERAGSFSPARLRVEEKKKRRGKRRFHRSRKEASAPAAGAQRKREKRKERGLTFFSNPIRRGRGKGGASGYWLPVRKEDAIVRVQTQIGRKIREEKGEGTTESLLLNSLSLECERRERGEK